MRKVQDEIVGGKLTGRYVPLLHKNDQSADGIGGYRQTNAPFVYTTDLVALMHDYIEMHERYRNILFYYTHISNAKNYLQNVYLLVLC